MRIGACAENCSNGGGSFFRDQTCIHYVGTVDKTEDLSPHVKHEQNETKALTPNLKQEQRKTKALHSYVKTMAKRDQRLNTPCKIRTTCTSGLKFAQSINVLTHKVAAQIRHVFMCKISHQKAYTHATKPRVIARIGTFFTCVDNCTLWVRSTRPTLYRPI